MKVYTFEMNIVAQDGADVDAILRRVFKHSEVSYWTGRDCEVTDYGEEDD